MRGNDALPLALLEQALNHNLRDSPAATRLLDRLHGHILALHLRELDRTLHLRAHPAGIQVLVATGQPADARLSGTLAGLTRLAAGASTGRLPPGVSLGGAAEVAEGFQQLLTLARLDPARIRPERHWPHANQELRRIPAGWLILAPRKPRSTTSSSS